MNNNLTRARCVLPDHSRPLVAGDLIPIATALDMLSQYNNRPFSLADIQNIYNQGGHITPVFWYEGKGVIYNPDNVLLNDAYYQQRYDGYISSDTYNDYLKLWLRSPHDITDIHGYFSLDFRNYDGLPFGNLLNLASYIALPQARLTAKAMLQITRINDHTTYSQAYACFVVPNTQPYNQPVSLTRIKSPLEIGLHDWLAPVAPFGIGGQPLTLDDAKQLYNQLKAKNPNVIYSIDEAKLHISFFTGYEHLHPYNDCQNMAILATNKATSDDPFKGLGGKE